MPYVRCPQCGNSTYSAAVHSGRDTCPFCDATINVSRGSREEDARPGSSDRRKELQQVDDAAPTDESHPLT